MLAISSSDKKLLSNRGGIYLLEKDSEESNLKENKCYKFMN